MKEQDARIDAGHRFVVYVEKSDASYGAMQTGSVMAKEYFDDFLEKRRHIEERCLRRLRTGEVSPVGYYMELLDMAEADLACRAGVWRWTLRRHRTPRGFARMRLDQARKYAEIFGIPLANLFQLLLPGEGTVQQEKSESPWVVFTRAMRGPA